MRTDREDRNEERVKWEEEGKWKGRYIETEEGLFKTSYSPDYQ